MLVVGHLYDPLLRPILGHFSPSPRGIQPKNFCFILLNTNFSRD